MITGKVIYAVNNEQDMCQLYTYAMILICSPIVGYAVFSRVLFKITGYRVHAWLVQYGICHFHPIKSLLHVYILLSCVIFNQTTPSFFNQLPYTCTSKFSRRTIFADCYFQTFRRSRVSSIQNSRISRAKFSWIARNLRKPRKLCASKIWTHTVDGYFPCQYSPVKNADRKYM